MDAAVGIQVYRVLQEALSNVARHAGTQRASVRLDIGETGLTLDVEDAGKGVDAQQAARGLGLDHDARARRAGRRQPGGRARPAGGTRVRLTVPLGPRTPTRNLA